MLRFGNISEFDPSTGYARVKFLDDGIVSDWLQVLVKTALNDKQSFAFDVNEQVACLMDEHSEEGVILGALYNDGTKPPTGAGAGVYTMIFSDESFVEYNKNTNKLTVSIQGDVDVVSTGTVSVDATNIGMTGVVNVTGSMTVSGAITAASISAGGVTADGGDLSVTGEISGATVVAGTINLGTHVHAGVQTGGGSTAPPTP
jgi:phage baseplate assembly protein V